ncbi:MAG: ribonuclease E inhibitor RraB [Verrucomicrobiia bacterium]
MKFKTNYQEGTWFAVPLRQGGYGVGVAARAKQSCVLAYFFGPRRESVPRLDEVSILKANSAVTVLRAGDLGLVNGKWPIIGEAQMWNRSDWPVPIFIRREILPPFRNWRVYYSDDNPNKVINEELEPNERPDLQNDCLFGYGAAEIKLTKLLSVAIEVPQAKFCTATTSGVKIFPDTPITGAPFRVEVLQQLRGMGSNTRLAHNFDFYLYFPSETAARAAAKKIRAREFTVDITPSTSDKKWLCLAKKVMVPESAPFDEIDLFFKQLAASLQGEFDGWESDVVK